MSASDLRVQIREILDTKSKGYTVYCTASILDSYHIKIVHVWFVSVVIHDEYIIQSFRF